MLFDSHAHYNDERFKDDVDEVLSAMNENNVGLILNSCSSLDEVRIYLQICEKLQVRLCVGRNTPHDGFRTYRGGYG